MTKLLFEWKIIRPFSISNFDNHPSFDRLHLSTSQPRHSKIVSISSVVNCIFEQIADQMCVNETRHFVFNLSCAYFSSSWFGTERQKSDSASLLEMLTIKIAHIIATYQRISLSSQKQSPVSRLIIFLPVASLEIEKTEVHLHKNQCFKLLQSSVAHFLTFWIKSCRTYNILPLPKLTKIAHSVVVVYVI